MENKDINDIQTSNEPSKEPLKSISDEDDIKATSFDEKISHQEDDESIDHTVVILSTAIPYLNGRSRKSMNMMLKAAEFANSFKDFGRNDELSACDLQPTAIDTENMLLDMKKVCSDKEREFLDVIINFINAQKIYNTYKTIANTSSTSSDGNFSNYAKMLGMSNMYENMGSSSAIDLLKNLLPQEQKESFDNISMLLNAMS